MKVIIQFEVPGNDPYDWDTAVAIEKLCRDAAVKVHLIAARAPGCSCTAPEDPDVLRDINGKTVGIVKVEET